MHSFNVLCLYRLKFVYLTRIYPWCSRKNMKLGVARTCISLGAPELGIALQFNYLGHFCSLLSTGKSLYLIVMPIGRTARCCNTLLISFLGPLNRSRICYLFLVTVHWVTCEQNLYVVIPLYVYDAMRELHFYANDGTLFSF